MLSKRRPVLSRLSQELIEEDESVQDSESMRNGFKSGKSTGSKPTKPGKPVDQEVTVSS